MEKEYHYQVVMIRTYVKGQSDMPTSEKVSRSPSQLVSLPLATSSEKAHISIPKEMRKKRKRKQCKDMEVGKDLWHKGTHTFEKDGFLVLEKKCNRVWKLKYPL